jgi:ribonucleoside-diphosphate reductase alpha chain
MPEPAAVISIPIEPPARSPSFTANPPLQFTRPGGSARTVTVIGKQGHRRRMDLAAVDQVVRWACSGVAGVDTRRLLGLCRKSLCNGMKAEEVGDALVAAILPLVESGAGYSQVCARLLLDSLWGEVSRELGKQTAHGGDFRFGEYPRLFKAGIRSAVGLGLLPENLLAFDLDRLSRVLCPERDKAFDYPSLRQIYDHHLLRSHDTRIELPQGYFMRVAMKQALKEGGFNERAIEIYLGSAR